MGRPFKKINVFFLIFFLLVCADSLFPAELPPIVKEAVQLELDGRLSEALDRYRAALSTEPSLVQDESLTQPLSVWIVSKVAHLSIDLGYGEEAWDWGTRLMAANNQPAAEAGTLVRMRLYRLQARWPEALKSFDAYAKAWPVRPVGTAMMSEEQRLHAAVKKSTESEERWLAKAGGPGSWIIDGDAIRLSNPTEALGLTVQQSVRLQVGAFKDWNHALTLINMLREKGWVPFTEVKMTSLGVKLHVVYLVSRQPQSDRARLETQGLTPLP